MIKQRKRILVNGRSWPDDTAGYLAYKNHERVANRWGLIFMVSVFLFISGCIVGKYAHAEDISTYDAVHAIIGEAENQNYKGMLAVACVIRNRGTLKGVYGLRAKRVRYSLFNEESLIDAKLAWEESAKHDITHGATHWENIKAFGRPYWVENCVETFRYKDHIFYRERGV